MIWKDSPNCDLSLEKTNLIRTIYENNMKKRQACTANDEWPFSRWNQFSFNKRSGCDNRFALLWPHHRCYISMCSTSFHNWGFQEILKSLATTFRKVRNLQNLEERVQFPLPMSAV